MDMAQEEKKKEKTEKASPKDVLKSKKASVRPKKKKEKQRGVSKRQKEEEKKEQVEDEEEVEEEEDFSEEEKTKIPVDWRPKTRLGRMVANREINTLEEALATDLPLREPEIVDILMPNLEDEVINVNMVQRMTDSGRRVRFSVMCVVGNGDGFVGLGRAKGKEVGPTIQKAIENAKLNIIRIRRACGSWECGCMRPHTVPFRVTGKCGSTEVTLKPAPQGVGLAIGDVAKKILKLAGIKDVWSFTRGQTRTTVNFSQAVFNALKETIRMRVQPDLEEKLQIIGGRP